MCGICGNLNFTKQHNIDTNQLKRVEKKFGLVSEIYDQSLDKPRLLWFTYYI
jgi:hypothetical protein